MDKPRSRLQPPVKEELPRLAKGMLAEELRSATREIRCCILQPPNFNGIERFTYSLGGRSRVEVAVTVSAVNDAPIANADGYRVGTGKSATVSSDAGVIANDVDVDGDVLTASLVGDVSNGTLQFESDGSFTYQPDSEFVGADSFTYKISDGTVESAEATVTIDVVSRPVSVHLAAIDANGAAVTAVTADSPLVVRATVQDLRSSIDADLGVGAAYLDIAYDVADVEPIQSPNMPLGLDLRFGSEYQNGLSGEVLPEGTYQRHWRVSIRVCSVGR